MIIDVPPGASICVCFVLQAGRGGGSGNHGSSRVRCPRETTGVAKKVRFPLGLERPRSAHWEAPLRPALPASQRQRRADAPLLSSLVRNQSAAKEGKAKSGVRRPSQPRTRPARRETSSSPPLRWPRKDPRAPLPRKNGPIQPPLDPFHLPQPGELGTSKVVAQTTRKPSGGRGRHSCRPGEVEPRADHTQTCAGRYGGTGFPAGGAAKAAGPLCFREGVRKGRLLL